MKFVMLQPEQIDDYWGMARDYLAAAFRFRIYTDTVDDYYDPLKKGEFQLWIAINDNDRMIGAVTTFVKEGTNAKVCTIVALGGEDLTIWVDLMNETLTNFAVVNRCDAIEAVTRRGFARFVPNWVEDGVCYVKDLRGYNE